MFCQPFSWSFWYATLISLAQALHNVRTHGVPLAIQPSLLVCRSSRLVATKVTVSLTKVGKTVLVINLRLFDTTAIKATAMIISYYLILGFPSHPSPLDRQQGILIPTSAWKLSYEAKFLFFAFSSHAIPIAVLCLFAILYIFRYGPPYRGVPARGTGTGIGLSLDTKVEPVSIQIKEIKMSDCNQTMILIL